MFVLQDVKYGIRTMVKQPAFSAVAVATLALGIGANTAIFSVVNALLLSPLPYPNPQQLVMVWEKRSREGVNDNPVSPRDFLDWRARNQVFESMAAEIDTTLDLSWNNEPERLEAGNVSPSFFDVLGMRPALGRTFLPEEEQAGRDHVVILSDSLWRRRFAADPSILGTPIQLSGVSYEVIGVLPPDFRFSHDQLQLWFPLNTSTRMMQTRVNHFLNVYARLKPGVTIEQARSEMDQLGEQMMQEFPGENNGHSAYVIPLHEQLVGGLRKSLMLLFGAVGLVLLIACANVANLMLVRAAVRHKEIAIRYALGARRSRIIRHFLTESMLLSAIGGGAGALLAMWGVEGLTLFVPKGLLSLSQSKLDLRTLGFTLAVSLVTGLLFGLASALTVSKPDLNKALKEGVRDSSVSRTRLRDVFIIAQIAIALVLLSGAGLLVRSFLKIESVQPGFNPENVLTAQVTLPSVRYREPKNAASFFEELLRRVSALPEVEAAGATMLLPLAGGDARTGIAIEGRDAEPGEPTRAHPRLVTPGYFEAMQMGLVNGRWINDRDNKDAPLVVMINQIAADRYWPRIDPVGKRLRLGGTDQWREIVGVVRNVKYWGLSNPVNPEMYLPYAQAPRWDMTLVARTRSNPEAIAGEMRDQLAQMDKDLPLSNVRTMEQIIDRSVESPRSYTILVSVFAGMALLLASVGVYGMMSYSVAQRTRELGVRIALGARPRDVQRLVLTYGATLTLIGIGLGFAGAMFLTRFVSSLLYQVEPRDPLTFGAVAFILGVVALVACELPARRATKVDPMVALRGIE